MIETDIHIFNSSSSKATNHKVNDHRERILIAIGGESANDKLVPTWRSWDELVISYCLFIHVYCQSLVTFPITRHRLERVGGRKFNYDFNLHLYDSISHYNTFKLEFKFNCDSVYKLPQFLQVRENLFLKTGSTSYAAFFYDNYLSQLLIGTGIIKPTKEAYTKYVYQTNYDKLSMFRELYAMDTCVAFKTKKRKIVHDSIQSYLQLYHHQLHKEALSEYLCRSQKSKIYMMYFNGTFIGQTLRTPQITVDLKKHLTIRNKNCIVVPTMCKRTHLHLLLRWKNHIGVLYPAYQIRISFD